MPGTSKSKSRMPRQELYGFDEAARSELPPGTALAGVDEAGRGPLAGPVVAAAAIVPFSLHEIYAVDDSKALQPELREELANMLMADPRVIYAAVMRSSREIDKFNILGATHQAMREAVIAVNAGFALVDGCKVPDFPVPARFVVKGDSKSASIAAASIIAKTVRDRYMLELDKRYPDYGFAKHKGYGTSEHLAALEKLGPCPEHRVTFAPVKHVLHPEDVQLEFDY